MTEDDESERQRHLGALDDSIARGIADAEADRVKPVDVVFDRLKAKYERLARDS